MLLNKHRLNAERGLPSPLCALPMHFDTLPISLPTVRKTLSSWVFAQELSVFLFKEKRKRIRIS